MCRGSPAATVKVGTLLTLRSGGSLTEKRWRKLKYSVPGTPTQPPVRLGGRSSSDCAPAGVASASASVRRAAAWRMGIGVVSGSKVAVSGR